MFSSTGFFFLSFKLRSKLLNFLIIIGLPIVLIGCASLNVDHSTQKGFYKDAKNLLDNGSYTLAIDVLNKMQSKYPYGKYSEQAWLEKAYAYLQSDDPILAQIEIDEFIRNYPNHRNSDYAYFMLAFSEETKIKGFIHTHINHPSKAHLEPIQVAMNRYQVLIHKYPNSKYVSYARKSIISLTNYAAKHELLIAKQYQEMQAWVAMIMRAEYALRAYPTSIFTDEALQLMVAGYRGLELEPIAKDIETVYQYNKANFSKKQQDKAL